LQVTNTAGHRTAHTAAFLTAEPGNTGGISGDCGGTGGVGPHGEKKLVRTTAD